MLDGVVLARLRAQTAACIEREAEEAFGQGAGAWHSCKAGKHEWLVFADAAICKAMFDTMRSNAP